MNDSQMDAPEHAMPDQIWADPPEVFDGMDMWRSEPGGKGVRYILATPSVLAADPAVKALVAEAEARGMERAAKLVDKRAEDYDRDYGSYDYSTGVTEYPGTGSESMEEWESIATEIRAVAAAIRGETP